MRVTIVTCFESNEERVSFVYDACKKKKYDVNIISSNFSHIKKAKREKGPKEFYLLETQPYNKNLSLKRILSHKKFAKDAFDLIKVNVPDVIWLMAPANSLISEANKFKKEYPQVKLIIDIIDMWPESLPISINKNVFPFNIWKNVRRNNIKCADALVTECDFYRDILEKEYDKKITTIHWSKDEKAVKTKKNLKNDKLSLCYIGSINNIIGTEIVKDIIDNCDKPVVLHVIGEGENRYNFVNISSRVCEVIYHGAIRDEKKKSEIFASCHAGLNIYKDDLYIGLTVKSIDYFKNGLPIINNIKGDTWKLIEKYKAGINIDSSTKFESKLLMKMRTNNSNIYKLYNDNFTKTIFIKNCIEVIESVTK